MESWAGARVVSRGKSYQRSKSVRDLAITESGELIAWVRGSTTYATKVSLDKGSLASVCSCPYYHACKHAVAVILEYLDCVEHGKSMPIAGKDDERLMLVEGNSEYPADDDDLDNDSEEDDIMVKHKRLLTKPGINDYLGQKSKQELLDLMSGIIAHHPEIRDEMNYKARIENGKPSALVKTVEIEIVKAGSEPGWRNYWKHTGYTPDYSRVSAGLRKLLDEGHADEVVRLGEKLFSAGITQVEQSHDEGETAGAVADSLTVVFEAMGKCSLAGVDKMERAVDFGLRDEYGLCHGLEIFWKQSFSKKDWGLLADRLLKRLSDVKYERQEDAFPLNYRRDRLTDEILHALENAGRQDEALSLCKQEAERTHSYDRLIKHLRKVGHTAEAETWIRKGISATCKKWPGIASSLKGELLNIRSLKRDWLFVAALHADDFFWGPSLKIFEDLKKASEKASVWPPVREAMLHFLETGKHPRECGVNWPLHDTGIETSDRSRTDKSPYTDVLIDIAIHEKRVDDILKWFEVCKKRRSNWAGDSLKDNVATAIALEYPDKAVIIWKELAEAHISMTNVSAYSIGAQYLRKAQKILKQNGRETEWVTYLQGLKERNRRKPRCIQILDALSEKPIIRSKQ
jgi:uncharacterized Zn finger protein